MFRKILSSPPYQLSRILHRGGPAQPLNEPTGYLFNEKPPPKGYKRVKEPWETPYLFFMGGSFVLATVGFYFQPDTRIKTWARKEALRRMAEKGEFQDGY
ncbi:hypothetical protein HMI54_000459 [Coelomomyces lativittatus]|nr:hypothetical protein HMI54_000459 [Coelomomyces lativittatus]KAJ1513534.1 hypothetical protein HMI55_005457 [Coelomomyces lativittatus]